jgi:hypothetical protein
MLLQQLQAFQGVTDDAQVTTQLAHHGSDEASRVQHVHGLRVRVEAHGKGTLDGRRELPV